MLYACTKWLKIRGSTPRLKFGFNIPFGKAPEEATNRKIAKDSLSVPVEDTPVTHFTP